MVQYDGVEKNKIGIKIRLQFLIDYINKGGKVMSEKKKINDMFEGKNKSGDSISEVLDILLKSRGNEDSPSFIKKTIYVVAAISTLAFVILICFSIYKNNFSVESILSTLLAFFSIFISIFFYFKADDTSTRFYESSYEFMKDISVTLGKIEERFGEKLNSLNDKISHLDRESNEATKEIEDKQEDKERIINELMEKANLSEEERTKYKKNLEEKESEILELRLCRSKAEREAAMLRDKIKRLSTDMTFNAGDDELRVSRPRVNRRLLNNILETGRLPDNLDTRTKIHLKESGCIDSDGEIDIDKVIKLMNKTY